MGASYSKRWSNKNAKMMLALATGGDFGVGETWAEGSVGSAPHAEQEGLPSSPSDLQVRRQGDESDKDSPLSVAFTYVAYTVLNASFAGVRAVRQVAEDPVPAVCRGHLQSHKGGGRRGRAL